MAAKHKDAEEARNQLPELLDAAQRGQSTIITKHGRPMAAIVPVDGRVARTPQRSLLSYAGTGRGLWRENSSRAIRALRDEWNQ